jgi:hypothetical protein
LPDQFVDVAYSLVLLSNHGAGLTCGAHLELLMDSSPNNHVNHPVACMDHVDARAFVPLMSASRPLLLMAPTPGASMSAGAKRPTSPADGPPSLTRPALAPIGLTSSPAGEDRPDRSALASMSSPVTLTGALPADLAVSVPST